MNKLITKSIGLILLTLVVSCKENPSYLSGFGLIEHPTSSNVKSFPVYFQKIRSWSKKNDFVLKSSKSEDGKIVEVYDGTFKSIGAVSLEISTSTQEGKEFLMYRVRFLSPVLKTEKTFDDMNDFQNQLKTIIPI